MILFFKNLLRIFIVLFLTFPFWFFLLKNQPIQSIDVAETLWAFSNTFIQAAMSALFCVLVGLVGSLGINYIKQSSMRTHTRTIEFFLIAPSLLPSLFSIIVTLNLFKQLPRGLFAIIICHIIIYSGLMMVSIASVIENQTSLFVETARTLGASTRSIFFKIVMPLIKKDLLNIFLLVFLSCFASFSVPLILGGGRGTTMEVLIYEKIKIYMDWPQAFILAFIQTVFLYSVSSLIKINIADKSEIKRAHVFKSRIGVLIIMFFIGAYYFTYFKSFLGDATIFKTLNVQEILNATMATMSLGFITAALVFVFLTTIAFVNDNAIFKKFLYGYLPPSTVLVGFAFIVAIKNNEALVYMTIPLAMCLLVVTTLYRLGLSIKVERLKNQIFIAKTLGAGSFLTFQKIIFPQISQTLFWLSSIAGIWACGDFAISRILATKSFTLGMMADSLMSTYHLNISSMISALILFSSLFVYLTINFIGTLSKKLHS